MKLKEEYLVLTMTFILGCTSYAMSSNKDKILLSENSNKDMYNIEVNENGQTYGTGLIEDETNLEPDLIRAEGINGKTGYIKKIELYDEKNKPSNPDEANIYMKNKKSKKIPLYSKDGVTIIDEFFVY